MTLDPVTLTERVAVAYGRYLRTLLRTNDSQMNAGLEDALERTADLVVGPILESSPPFLAGSPLAGLAKAGVLSDAWLRDPFGSALPSRRPLYAHQETAILKVAAGRNVVVATGTGSGKTETFLVPILDALLRQQADGRLGPGVRALLLYPMNALANDQVSRLRSILAHAPEITFGRYIGETAQTYQQALEDYRDRNEGRNPLPNELISREQMQETPPHILLTNYAMLEYLLMRPDDSPLFNVQTEDTWRFLVLDEVHTYNGTTGLEISMLLRRLFNRVRRGPDEIRCIGTSATIAGGEGDLPLVAAFAERLFGAPFEYDPADTSRQDVVLAERRPDQLEGPELDLGPDVFKAETPDHQLLRDQRVHRLVKALRESPRKLVDLAAELFPGDPEAQLRTAALVNRLSSTKVPGHDDPVLRARYHTFVRAIGGVQVCLRPHGPDGSYRFTLADDRWCDVCGEGAALSELASCRKCNQWHLRGRFEKADSAWKFSRQLDWDDTSEAIVYLGPGDPEVEADEEASIEEESAQPIFESAERDATTSRRLVICRVCLAAGETARGCSCSPNNTLQLIRAATKKGRPDIRYCVNCGASSAQNGPRRLRPGQDGPPAVLASTLYDSLQRETEAPKFISFADSRQDAAFFGPYLGRTYGKANRRRLIFSVICEMWKDHGERPLRISDIKPRLRQAAEESGHFTSDVTPLKQGLIPRMWLLAELSAVDQRQSLAGVGLLARRAARPEGWRTPPDMPAGLAALSDDESWTLVETLVGQLLDRGILALGKDIDPADEVFRPRSRNAYIRRNGSDPQKGVEAWLPANTTARSARLDYLERLLARLGRPADRGTALSVLEWTWDNLLVGHGSPAADLLRRFDDRRLGILYQVNPDLWEFAPPTGVVVCSHCGIRRPGSVAGVCPTMRCQGTLAPDNPDEDNHYRRTYQEPPSPEMRVEEHTAQWTPEEAARIQDRFVRGQINVLSCSTTFELGVDLGDLQAVFMRNIPPTVANYVQRAGRAGRRREAAALVVTFAQHRPHDQQMVARPEELVAGRVPVPRVADLNVRIARRHVHAVALSRFFRERLAAWSDAWHTAGSFFLASQDGSPTPAQRFREYLEERDNNLRDELLETFPGELHDPLGIGDWSWVEELVREDSDETRRSGLLPGPLSIAEANMKADAETYRALIAGAVQREEYGHAKLYRQILETLRGRYLLGYLASYTVLPKYGFPVDIVPLQTEHLEGGNRIELERDLRIAVAEFAPGSGVVAAGELWVSVGARRFPDRALPEEPYAVCGRCRRFYPRSGGGTCSQCGGSARTGTMVLPLYGFVAGKPTKRGLGDERPRRLWASEVYFFEHSANPGPFSALFARGGETVSGRFSRNGWLAVVNTGSAGKGFSYCAACGHAWPNGASAEGRGGTARSRHSKPGGHFPCGGRMVTRHFGHKFATDMAEFVLSGLTHATEAEVRSVQAALEEAAARVLNVPRGELGSLFYYDGLDPVFVLYDNVPGGAGLARSAHGRAEEVLSEAYRVTQCDSCGPGSSCYRCLRTYGNQHYHEELNRTAASSYLKAFANG